MAVAGQGFLEPGRPVFFSASLAESPEVADQAGALLILTDSNRKRGQRWGTIRETQGYTERLDQVPLVVDPTDQRLGALPDVPDSQTVAVQGGVRASATAYGNPVTFVPDSRPFNAVDGDLTTAWKIGAFSDARGERLLLEYDEAFLIGGVDLQQVVVPGQTRHITEVRIRTSETVLDATLDGRSFPPQLQRIELPRGTTDFLEIEILGTSDDDRKWFFGARSVGFTEVGQSPFPATETIALPGDLTVLVDRDAGQHLAVVLSRQRSDPLDPVRTDGELSLDRTFTLPFARTFTLEGDVRLATTAPTALADDLLGLDEVLRVEESSRLSGSLRSGGHAAIDGDLATAWIPAFGPQEGQTLTLEYRVPQEFEGVRLLARRSDNHSLPVEVTLFADHSFVGASRVTSVGDDYVVLDFDIETSATLLEFVVMQTDTALTFDWYSSHPVVLPVAFIEVIGLPEVAMDATVDDSCRDDLVQLDGAPLSVQVLGSTEDALARRPLGLELCGPLPEIAAGTHQLTTTPGRDTGFDIDRLVLRSLEGAASPASSVLPSVRVVDWGKTGRELEASASSSPFWLVLGESFSDGWRLSSEDVAVVGAPVLIDGYANGWLVDPTGHEGDLALHLEWTPQRLVRVGLLVSLLAALLCLGLARWGRRDEGTGEVVVLLVDPRGGLAVSGNGSAVSVGMGVAAAAWLFLPAWPLAAPLLGVVTGLVLAGRCWRRVLPLTATGLMAAAALMIVVDQVRFRYPRDFIWPTFFDQYHVLGVLAVLCALAEALRSLLARRAFRPDGAPSAGQEPSVAVRSRQ